MAYTNNNGQTRVGVRIVPLSVVIPTISTLLDSYSGAAVAYSLRKLNSSYTGSAIRVRRSSDNTELNIGFDSNGNLDTYSLSTFVGTGNGFVTTWYDQSGSGNNATQTTSSSQPRIVNAGIIETVGGKPAVRWLVIGGSENLLSMNTSLSNVRSVFLNITYLSGIARVPLLGHTTAYDYHSDADVYLSSQYAANYVKNGSNYINGVSKTLATFTKSSSNSLITMIHTSASGNVNQISSDRNIGRWDWSFFTGYFSEIILYSSDQTTNRINIESNINTYYSIYPNHTSVWNLLNAVYSADTTALPSLKTSLVASYNGESNANDSFGSNNGTAVGGVTYTAGKIGDAFQFNGSTSYVSLPNDSLNFTGDFTVNAWFNSSTYTGLRGIASSYKVVGSLAYGWIANHDDSTNKFGLYFRDGSNTMLYRTYAGVPLNSYHMITWVRKVGQDPKIYINGVYSPGEYTFGNSSSNPSYQTGQPCNLGGWNNTSYGNHKQDATNFWSKALTQSEITELYNSGNGAQYITNDFYKPTTNDALGTNNGTAQGGLTYGLGKVGTAFQFNGTNAYVSIPNNSWNFTDDFSVSFWINPTFTSGVDYRIIGTNYYAGGTFGNGWQISRFTNNKVAIQMGSNSSTGQVMEASSTMLPNNTWTHVVVTRKKSTSTKIYINGADVTSSFTHTLGNSSIDPGYATTQYCQIGANKYDTNPATGFVSSGTKMDGLSVWQKELTQADVTELYNSGNGKQYPN